MLSPELEELLSGYLDGELSPGERSRAEHLLADRPECRHFLDELRSLRHSLQTLQRHAAPADFAQRVQTQIERGPAPPIATPAPSADESPRVTSSGRRWIRPLVWSSLAIAAALVIMALSPQQIDDERDGGPVRVAWNETTESAGNESALDESTVEQRKPEDPQFGAAPASTMSRTEADGVRSGAAAGGARHVPGSDAAATESLAETEAPNAAPVPAAPPLMADAPAADVATPLLLVQCDLTPEAARQDAFRNLLSQARITWDSIPLETDLVLTDERSARVERSVEVEQRTPATAPTPSATDSTPAADAGASTDDTLELVLVEAPPEQLEAMLAQINSQAREFPAVVVTPAAEDQTRANWLQYNRAATPQAEAPTENAADKERYLFRKSRARESSPAEAGQSATGASTEATAPAAEDALPSPPAQAPPDADAASDRGLETPAPAEESVSVDQLREDQRALQSFMTQNSANFAAALRRRTEQQSATEEPTAQPRAQRIVLPEGRSIHELLQISQSHVPASPPVAPPGPARRDAEAASRTPSTEGLARPALRRQAGNRPAESMPPLQQAIFLLRVVPQPEPAAP